MVYRKMLHFQWMPSWVQQTMYLTGVVDIYRIWSFRY